MASAGFEHGHKLALAEQLGRASRNGDVEQMHFLLCRGADLSVAAPIAAQKVRGFEQSTMLRTPMELALEGRSANAVRFLLQHGADPHGFLSDGLTPLHHAAEQDDLASAIELVHAGASTHAKGVRGQGSALTLALAKGSYAFARDLRVAASPPPCYPENLRALPARRGALYWGGKLGGALVSLRLYAVYGTAPRGTAVAVALWVGAAAAFLLSKTTNPGYATASRNPAAARPGSAEAAQVAAEFVSMAQTADAAPDAAQGAESSSSAAGQAAGKSAESRRWHRRWARGLILDPSSQTAIPPRAVHCHLVRGMDGRSGRAVLRFDRWSETLGAAVGCGNALWYFVWLHLESWYWLLMSLTMFFSIWAADRSDLPFPVRLPWWVELMMFFVVALLGLALRSQASRMLLDASRGITQFERLTGLRDDSQAEPAPGSEYVRAWSRRFRRAYRDVAAGRSAARLVESAVAPESSADAGDGAGGSDDDSDEEGTHAAAIAGRASWWQVLGATMVNTLHRWQRAVDFLLDSEDQARLPQRAKPLLMRVEAAHEDAEARLLAMEAGADPADAQLSLYDNFDFYAGRAPNPSEVLGSGNDGAGVGAAAAQPSESGTAADRPFLCEESELSEDDIEMVMLQAAVGRAQAIAALRACNGDMMDACLMAADV